MAINLNHLTVFHAAAKNGGIRAGADRLLISQPAASKQIKELERALGVRLFERHARGVRVTAEGGILADYARRIFALAEDAETALSDLDSLRHGSLAIGASPTIGTYLLPAVLVHFRRRFPGVDLRLEIESSQVLRKRLEEFAIDFGITEGRIEASDLESKSLMEDELIAIIPPDHPFARRRSVKPAAFCREPFITHEPASSSGSFVEQVLEARNLKINPLLSLSSTEAIKQAVASGLGVAIVSRLAAKNEIASKRLATITLTGLSIRRPIYHVCPRNRYRSKGSIAFLCLLKHAIRGTLPRLPAPVPSRQSVDLRSERR